MATRAGHNACAVSHSLYNLARETIRAPTDPQHADARDSKLLGDNPAMGVQPVRPRVDTLELSRELHRRGSAGMEVSNASQAAAP